MSGEQWRPVTGYEGHYEVSDLGRVRSLDRQGFRSDGRPRRDKGRVLKTPPDRYGYPVVNLSLAGRVKMHRVHQLTARAFLGDPEPGYEVCHEDADRSNGKLSNLRWGTRSDNMYDRVRHGNHPLMKKEIA